MANCFQCGATMRGKVCLCGWTASVSVNMPTLDNLFTEIDESIKLARRKPLMLPKADQSRWMVNLFSPHEEGEAPRKRTNREGKVFWQWPYADRINMLTKKFISASDKLQSLVLAAREDKIYWFGWDTEFFMSVIIETEDMREIGVPAYRAKTLKKMRAFGGLR